MNEDCIRKNLDRIDWRSLLYRRGTLSEDFIREFQDKVDWYRISRYQDLSKTFILEFLDKLDIRSVLECQDLDSETREYLKLLKG